jgi:hypothetical protein
VEEKAVEKSVEEQEGIEGWRLLASIMLALPCRLICSLSTIQVRVANPGPVIKLRHTFI